MNNTKNTKKKKIDKKNKADFSERDLSKQFIKKNHQNQRQNKISMFRVRVMVINATFNNISVILWWSLLLVEDTVVPGENHQPEASY
jgi:hypothetical protein